MESISHAIATAGNLHQFIHAEIKAKDNKTRNEHESAESAKAKIKVMTALRGTIGLVEGTLAHLRADRNAVPRPSRGKSARTSPAMSRATMVALAAANSPADQAAALQKSMSADKDQGLGSQVKSLSDMATAIVPIMQNFDDVLSKPYLNTYSATLNTVPVVGLKNKQIMYLAKQPNMISKTGVKDVWTYFGNLPTGVTIDDTSNVHLFPYKGDFCLSVGPAVWRKRHRQEGDPVLKQAVDNWPKMYLDEWEKIGDTVFPADLRDVVPFAVLSADRKSIDFKLVVLAHDQSIQVLNQDDIYPTNAWSTLAYQKTSGGSPTPPTWTRVAYWNNTLVAIDGDSNLWNIHVDFSQNDYTIADKTTIDPTAEFTATDIGPVVLKSSDGYLYQRYVADPPSDGSDPPLKWTRWVLQDGVTHLGVASPGVILDLNTLTQTLKSRYIETQKALYPVVNRINAFAVTHGTYLDLLMQAADDWANAPNDQKEAQAIKAGTGFVTHAKVWATLLNKAISNNKEAVNVMTSQLHDVRIQLEVQLQILKDKLVGLESTLKVQKEALSKLQAAFWGAMAAALLGLALSIILVATGVGAAFVVAAGALCVAGVVAMITLSVKMSELAGQISDTQSQIDTTSTAITQLSAVVSNFTSLDTLYGTLNIFWGRMLNQAVSLAAMDEATALQLGDSILADTSSIVAAQGVTKQIADAATLYLDTLNKQGIHIDPPTIATAMVGGSKETHIGRLASLGVANDHSGIARRVSDHIGEAHDHLRRGDASGYHRAMFQAATVDSLHTTAVVVSGLSSGAWYDIPRLSDAASLINGNALQQSIVKAKSSGVVVAYMSADASSVSNQVNAATVTVVSMLQKTASVCSSIQDLLQKYKQYSQASDQAGIEGLKDSFLQPAIDECLSAQALSAQANNAFTDVNHTCQEYQQRLTQQVSQLSDNSNAARNQAGNDMNNISVPFYVYLGGPAAVMLYELGQRKDISARLDAQLHAIQDNIDTLNSMMQSGASVDGHALAWGDMAKTVSQNLGGVYNILTAVSGQVLEDPVMYDSLLSVEWGNIAKNSQEVLNILASRGVSVGGSSIKMMTTNTQQGTHAHAQAKTFAVQPSNSVNNTKAVSALKSPNSLGPGLKAQATQTQDIFTAMDKLLKLPYLSSLIGYWDGSETEKTTLLDVVTNLQRRHIDMLSSEYSVVQELFTTSLLQETRAQLVQQGKLKPSVLVSSSLRSARAGQKAASDASTKLTAASSEFQTALKQINANLVQIQSKLAEVDKSIGDLEKQERDKIIALIADVVALAFASAIILAGLGVFGPVAAALTTAQALGLGATATAAAVKTAVDGLGLADIEKLLGALRSTRRDLDETYATLKTVQPLLSRATADAAGIGAGMDAMVEGLGGLAEDAALMRDLVLTDGDVEGIGKSWVEVRDAATGWMDVVNARGIVPADG